MNRLKAFRTPIYESNDTNKNKLLSQKTVKAKSTHKTQLII